MHCRAFVLVPPSIKEDVRWRYAAEKLRRYDANLPINLEEYPTNPEAEWDWCCIWGRWDSMVSGKLVIDERRVKMSEEEADAMWLRNTVKVSDIPPDFLPAAIITPDGRWHDEYEDFGGWSKDDRRWVKLARDILNRYRDFYVVLADCHRW